ncbi:MAG TPA: TonB-dependent receptor [Candidatus Saccharimonadales bacterium]|nr:TonB-dependent receptor [Candidatus Saccharimonadales bacterium]
MNKRNVRGNQYRRNALSAALAVSLGFTGLAYGQATTGSVFGTAPVAAGETVRVVNNQTGLTREVPVDSSGRYSVTNLPIGNDYTVSLVNNGQVVSSKSQVTVSVNGGTKIPFVASTTSQNVQNLSGVTVTANALPAIDVSSTRQTSVITAQQLKQLPLARNAESIAVLAPGVAGGNASLGTGPAGTPLISFGGDSTAENAYYINGFNTTDPVGNAGGIALPYFAIAEQQTITSGYGAEYGRSTGGVISQIGHRGGNDFHAGVYVTWAPTWAQSGYDNIHYANPASTTAGQQYGDIFVNRRKNEDWSTVYDAYISGPLIKDKLFFYITAEAQHDSSKSTGSVNSPYWNSHSTTLPKFYGKLDWNINDNNILEATYASSKLEDKSNNAYDYDYSTGTVGDYVGINNPLYSSKFDIGILKYTSYITDDLTLSVLAGKMKSSYYSEQYAYPGFNLMLAGVSGVSSQNPTVPGAGNTNNNALTIPSPDHKSTENNFRLDLDWHLGDHDLKFGIDNMRSTDLSDGSMSAGPGYYWIYGKEGAKNFSKPTLSCNALGQCVDNPINYPNGGAVGTGDDAASYYVVKRTYGGVASFTVEQKAQYVEDNWQVTPNLLLNLGLRNDQFTNYSAGNQPYIRETSPQWQPRLGFSWDIFGDSSAKLYGNVGRYYLALPTGLGVRMAGANAYLNEYYTYSSIDENGIPQGLTQIHTSATPYSPDGEYGTPKDPKTIAAADLKPMYQDEYVLGFQKEFNAFGQSLVWTSQATYSKMNNIIDDVGTVTEPADALDSAFQTDILVNPGRSNEVRYLATDGTYKTYKWNPHTATGGYVTGYPDAFRKYYSLEEALEHPWDGKWMGKIDYVFAKSFGTTEGPTYSPLGQASNASAAAGGGQSGSISEAWDFPELMEYSNGELPNSHRHTLKAYGTYAITPEWLVSGLYIVQSGAPITCLGAWGPDQIDAEGYGEAYHWCDGQPSPPGRAGHLPWTHKLDLSVSYIPEWAGKHLTLQVQVQNVFNEQKTTAYTVTHDGVGGAPDTSYKLPIGGVTGYAVELPRYAEFSVKYDW